MDTILNAHRSAAGAVGRKEPASGFATYIAAVVRNLMGLAERARQRRALLALDDWMLKDIGLSRADAQHEYVKRFWQE
jgi:uncharacterized protein YjiS (DUF1127 family)